MATKYYPARPAFVADWSSVTRDTGHTIDWAEVSSDYEDDTGKKFVPGGTPMGYAGDGIAPAREESAPEAGDGIEAQFLLATHAHEGSKLQNRSSYGVIRGGVIYENLLPVDVNDFKSDLNDNGTGFSWAAYGDSTAE